jgi:hypothetical protein
MERWQRDAHAAGFDPDALATVAELVARGFLDVDGPPFEELPGFWVVPGFAPYDGHIILTTADRTHLSGRPDAARELAEILGHAVADGAARSSSSSSSPPGRRGALVDERPVR